MFSYLTIVVMEYIEGAHWLNVREKAIHDKQLLDAANELKKENFVHGDIREPNIIISSNKKKLFLIDFELSGKEGEVRYTFHLNTSVKWHEGAQYGNLIRCEHDQFMVEQLLKN